MSHVFVDTVLESCGFIIIWMLVHYACLYMGSNIQNVMQQYIWRF